jgi:hypothetical protein
VGSGSRRAARQRGILNGNNQRLLERERQQRQSKAGGARHGDQCERTTERVFATSCLPRIILIYFLSRNNIYNLLTKHYFLTAE